MLGHLPLFFSCFPSSSLLSYGLSIPLSSASASCCGAASAPCVASTRLISDENTVILRGAPVTETGPQARRIQALSGGEQGLSCPGRDTGSSVEAGAGMRSFGTSTWPKPGILAGVPAAGCLPMSWSADERYGGEEQGGSGGGGRKYQSHLPRDNALHPVSFRFHRLCNALPSRVFDKSLCHSCIVE